MKSISGGPNTGLDPFILWYICILMTCIDTLFIFMLIAALRKPERLGFVLEYLKNHLCPAALH
ncbi:hypothetical protein K449DRAFT_181144 [Hypoxylon sp. EC38]|nr:hypothetical protein K449DRAFT_181144 [Hypoxylon sp. EC38]